jgi:predicted transcriptional regulator
MSIDQEAEDAFQAWYQTEGVRTPVPAGEHWHEAYQRMAFMGAVSYMNKKALFIESDIEFLEEEADRIEAKIKAINKLVKVLIRQNRK